ncbi:MAG: Glycerate 3-kinase [Verrucomicrobiae bacterium]|nr:Glycerate 3-kinase [Verrucomicrobiae bacterium]
MKIIVAFDKFKGSLTAPQACAIVARELSRHEVIQKPMADGGDGTVNALHAALGGEWISKPVTGPLPGMKVTARYLCSGHNAFIEMAQASGLVLLQPEERNPLLTTTYGTGELIADALHRGAQHIWLAVGGSATNDGGVGAAMALGWRFLDARGESVGLGGGGLERIASILPPATSFPPVEVLCDVSNPLCGERGAAAIFGPQKGATPALVERLDNGLRHLASLVQADILDVPGSGAAGGLAGGAIAFLNARLVPGIETIMRVSQLPAALLGADWVITGEGQFDEQSLHGKVVAGVTAEARRNQVKVAVVAGRVRLPESAWRHAGISAAFSIAPAEMPAQEAMRRAPELLTATIRQLQW